ncbi:MAG: phosphate--AMP phosphotransferase [Candidatus Anammoximicrobium sp.]|nr:phosphate--AMP phosphotransferase [Candidatus Anammoximicrobium sp.]
MLELIDLDKRLPKKVYEDVFPKLEVRLGECQRAAKGAGVPVIVVFEGWDAAGKGTVINRLTQALDPRGFAVHAIKPPNETERFYPWLWRFWNKVPAAGQIGIFDRSWYMRVLEERVEQDASPTELREAYEDILQFERQLADSGAVIVKFWLHISRKEQRRRQKRLLKDPATAWTVGKAERRQNRKYDAWLAAVEMMLERTLTARAPWTVVEATHDRYTRTKVFETMINAIEEELDHRRRHPPSVPQPMPKPELSPTQEHSILDRVDLSLSLDRKEYEKQLDHFQARLRQLEHELYSARIPAAIVYCGWDAAGKGGNIRRLTSGLDPRGYQVVPISAPTAEEKARHYLWRFWRQLPKAGHITIFDRSWYGRVMVERVEGFCTEDEWKRAYREINEFERELTEYGTVLVKFWLHIDADEQLRRFRSREQTEYKRWKITDEDWRNRKKWNHYKVAVTDMLRRTSTTNAPWTILEANDKLYARIKALKTVAAALEAGLARR